MKNLITLSLLILSISAFGQKQYLGFKGGVSFTNLFINDDPGLNDYRTGINGGLTYEYEFKNNFHIGVDFVYAQKGSKYDAVFMDNSGKKISSVIHYNYDYLSLPIKGGYSIGNRIEGFLNLGFVPSILVNAKLRAPGVFVSGSDGTIDIKDDVRQLDLSGLVEIGGNYEVNERLLLFTSFTYQHSFTQLAAKDNISNSDVRHYGMILSLGVKFGIGE